MRQNRIESIIVECNPTGIGVHVTAIKRYRAVYRWHAGITRASYARIARLRRSGVLQDHSSWNDSGRRSHSYTAPFSACMECGTPLYFEEITHGVCFACLHDQHEIWIARHFVGCSLLPDDQEEYYASLLDGEE